MRAGVILRLGDEGMSAEKAEVKTEATPANLQTFGSSRLAPGMYILRFSKALDEALLFQVDGKECCFFEAYQKLRDSKIKEIEPQHHPKQADRYVTEAGDMHVAGGWRELRLLRDVLELACNGADPFDAMWFPYDWDVSRDADVSHSFFVLYAGKIVDESFHFSDGDPLVLRPCDLLGLEREENSDPVWRSHPRFDSAFACYWYRKFYTETMTGQLMVLRPDEPNLYYYREGRSKAGVDGRLPETAYEWQVETDLLEGEEMRRKGAPWWEKLRLALVEPPSIQGVLAQIRVAIWVLVALAVLQLVLR